MTGPDLHNAAFLRNPGPVLDQLRKDGGLVRLRLPLLGDVWGVPTYRDCHRLLGDAETFCRNPANAGGKEPERSFWWAPPFLRPLFRNVTLMDGSEHARLRRLAAPAFSTIEIDRISPDIGRIAEGLLNKMPAETTVDLIDAYARRVPLAAICALLGIPEQDRAKVIGWVEPVGSVASVTSFFRAVPGLWRLSRHFRKDFEAVRQAGGRPGVIGDLVMAHVSDPGAMSDDELLAMVVALFIGGFDTTTHLISNTILTLLQTPGQREALRKDPAGWQHFIEEVMRFQAPVMFTNAFHVTRDTELGGQKLTRGERVVPLLISANRDTEVFPAADQMLPDRKPNRHLGFGYGTHVCLGMQLARAEAMIAARAFDARFPDAVLGLPYDQLPMLRRVGLRGAAKLPVRTGRQASAV